MATNTPWGQSQNSHKVERGLTFHETASHGGFLVSKGYAEKNLSPAALKKALKWGNYYAFEEDCLSSIVIFEIAAAKSVFFNPSLLTEEYTLKHLSRWYPDYLIERGIKPTADEYAEWLVREEDKRLRRERSANLIISARSIDKHFVKVTTADGADHVVTYDSYQRRHGLNLLSKCKVVLNYQEA